jgi:hypothetical protein
MFRDSFKRRRCIIPASGFFEWTNEADDKQPHLLTAADGSPILAFAGLWDHWIEPATKEETLSCTVIVSGACARMMPYHDRMPVLLRAEDFEARRNGSLAADALRPAAESALREWCPCHGSVNRTGVGNDDPTIIEKWMPLMAPRRRIQRCFGLRRYQPLRGCVGKDPCSGKMKSATEQLLEASSSRYRLTLFTPTRHAWPGRSASRR